MEKHRKSLLKVFFWVPKKGKVGLRGRWGEKLAVCVVFCTPLFLLLLTWSFLLMLSLS